MRNHFREEEERDLRAFSSNCTVLWLAFVRKSFANWSDRPDAINSRPFA